MKQYLVRILTCGAACLALAAQSQTTPSQTTPGTSSDTSSSSDKSSSSQSSQSGQWRGRFGATGRMGQQELRGSKLMGSDVKTSAGESLGKIEDVVINP